MAEVLANPASERACGRNGHDGRPAAGLVTTACIHEHVRTDVPCCEGCVDWAEASPLCCIACHDADDHCCPLTVTVKRLAGES